MNQDICDRIEDLEFKYKSNYSTIYSLVWKERNKLFVRELKKKGFYCGFPDKFEYRALDIVERYYRLNYSKVK